MTLAQVTSHVRSILSRPKAFGYSIEQLWHGIHPNDRHMVALALQSMLRAGELTVGDKRYFDAVGNVETVPAYRLA